MPRTWRRRCAYASQAPSAASRASRFGTWLYAVTLNAARDQMRKRRRSEWRDAAYLREQAVLEGGSGDDGGEELWQAVRQLPDKQRDAVLLIYGEGLAMRRRPMCSAAPKRRFPGMCTRPASA